jgi:hypothetical protein
MHCDGDVDRMSVGRAKPLTFATRAMASIYSKSERGAYRRMVQRRVVVLVAPKICCISYALIGCSYEVSPDHWNEDLRVAATRVLEEDQTNVRFLN